MAAATRSGRQGGRRRAGTRTIAPAGLAQVRALAHPLRLRLIELFTERARTTKQAAETMGEAPTRLYHHVAALERAGLVRLVRTQRVRGATEKYFEVVRSAPGPAGGSPVRTAAGRRGTTALGVMLFEEGRRELVQALARCSPGELESMLALRAVLRLTPAENARLRRELTNLLRALPARRPESAGASARRRRYSLTIALVPADADGGTD